MANHVTPSGRETFFPASELIVSKTDLKGRLTYANGLFCQIAGYRESELIGQPHSMIRHPDMPRSVFRLLWDTIEDRREIFAFVKNMASSGDHYWVFAHVTPSFDAAGAMIGYHSNRRAPRSGDARDDHHAALCRSAEDRTQSREWKRGARGRVQGPDRVCRLQESRL